MKNKFECKIIQEYLLPNYIEKLTDKETNEYIENHLAQCMECKEEYENMQKGTKEKSFEKEEIAYMKRFNKKISKLKALIILIIIVLIITLSINMGSKLVTVSNLYNKAKKYENSENYHITMYTYNNSENNEFSKSEIYKMNNKIKIVDTLIDNNGITKTTTLGVQNESGEYDTKDYIETANYKVVIKNGNLGTIPQPRNLFYTENKTDLLKSCFQATIKDKNINNTECYYFGNWKTNQLGNYINAYVDKETGLEIYINEENQSYIFEQVYEFDTVTEKDFSEPNTSEYKEMTLEEYAKNF